MADGIRAESLTLPGTGDTSEMRCYTARPDDSQRHPGVIILHEAFGLVPHTEDLARRFAREGYIAIAPNLFSTDPIGSSLTEAEIGAALGIRLSLPPERRGDPTALAEAMSQLPAERARRTREITDYLFSRDQGLFVPQVERAVEWLRAQPGTSGRVGITGFCYGGGVTLRTVFAGAPIDAAAPFYGSNPPLDDSARVSCPLMLMYGRDDPRLMGDLPKLLDALVRADKPFELHVYEGARHAFMNNEHPEVYNPRAAQDAWSQLLRFFGDHLS